MLPATLQAHARTVTHLATYFGELKEAALQLRQQFGVRDRGFFSPSEDEAARHFGRLCHELRRVGRIMSVVDMQLAAIAFALGNCTVVTKDGDLSAVPGLQVENWATA